MTEPDEDQPIARRPQATAPVVRGQPVRVIRLGQQDVLDVTNLPVQAQDALEAKANELAIERDDRARQIKQDLTVMAAQLNTYTKAVADMTAVDAAATITNTKTDSLGTTTTIVGNTDAARSGRLNRTQLGLSDNARIWIILALIAGVVIVLVAALKR